MTPKKRFLVPAAAAAFLSLAAAARADVLVFSDNFNSENDGSTENDYTGFANWDVTSFVPGVYTGALDLVSDDSFTTPPGGATSPSGSRGLFVDMDGGNGSTIVAGILQTKSTLSALSGLAAGTYRLDYYLAGGQSLPQTTGTQAVDQDEQVGVQVLTSGGTNLSAMSYSMYGTGEDGSNVGTNGTYTTGFTLFSRTFTLNAPTSIVLRFSGSGNNDIGMLLDDVALYQVAAVPLPAAVWMGLLPMGGLALWRLRQRKRRQAL